MQQKKMPLLLIIVLGLAFSGFSQQQTIIKPLTIGNTMPDITFNVMNSSKPTAKLSDYKGKYIILDFWATWCSSCVGELPKLAKLQQQFKDSLQIIAITSDNTSMVQSFFKRHNASFPKLVFIAGDTLLTKYLKHKTVPHEVWLDAAGKIIAITTEQYVNADNISQVLKTGKADWPVKDEAYKFPFQTASVFGLTPVVRTATINNTYYSGITGYVEGINYCGLYTKKDSATNTQRYNMYNLPIPSLYSLVYKGKGSLELQDIKRNILHVEDSGRFIYNERKEYRDKWNKKNWHSYEIVLPLSYSNGQIQKKAISDLDFFFQLHSAIEEKSVECWILKSCDSLLQQKTGGSGIPQHTLNKDEKGNYIYKQEADWVSSLVETMNKDSWLYQLPLVIDETNYGKLVTLELHLGKDVSNLNVWREQLKKLGFDLVPEYRKMEMLILSEDKN